MLPTPNPALPLLAAAFFLAACSRSSAITPTVAPPAAPGDADAESVDMLREAAREVLATNCGECHTSGLGTALPRALAVYDLDQLDWSRRMSVGQLREAERRMGEPIAPTLGEGEARAIRVSAADLDRFHRFVEVEVTRIGRAP